MNMSDLRPAHEFALQYGVKAVIYGGPGSAKTPVCITTAPSPVALMSEPGFLSIRKSTVLTYPAFNSGKVDEFMLWFCGSQEAKNFQTLVWDSVSQSHEQRVEEELGGTSKAGNEAHGQRAYGKANRWMMEHLFKLYFLKDKHIILITKMQNFELNGMIYKRPYFAGRELPIRVPHLFDEVLQLGDFAVPGVTPSPTKAFRCKEQFDLMARDRSGNLSDYEPPNIASLITKCLV